MKPAIHLVLSIVGMSVATSAWSACPRSGESNVQLQILGSGGPDTAGRASTSYLLWIGGTNRIMVDAGGGANYRFQMAGGRVDDLELLALSHLHPDHSVDLPALLWPEGGSLAVAGPTAAGVFPSIEDFLGRLFGADGAYRVLAGEIDLHPVTVDVTGEYPVEVWRDGDLRVHGTAVPHADVPAVGYRVDVGDYRIAFAGDQNGSNPSFIGFIDGVDVLVVHLGGPEDATGEIADLHARPSVWGAMAAAAGAGHVVVGHIGMSSARELDANVAILREHFGGRITISEDLMCIDVG